MNYYILSPGATPYQEPGTTLIRTSDGVAKTFSYANFSYSSDKALQQIREWIDAGEVVYLMYHHSMTSSSEGGLMTNRAERAQPGEKHAYHAVAITGYALDSEGRIGLLKLQNSWGVSDRNDGGFYYMSAKLFGQVSRALTRLVYE